MTGTRPATCSSDVRVRTSRSASDSENCSEKLARMQTPSTPASIMKSRQRFWLPTASVAGCASMRVAGHSGPPAADQEVKVAAIVGLQYVVHIQPLVAAASAVVRASQCGQACRSEEHTSELQSHVNLVCR